MAPYAPHPDVIATELEGEAVLLDLRTRRYYSLNETGTRVWQGLGEGLSQAEIAEALTREWEVERAEAEAYVAAFLEDLAREQLVEQREPAPPQR